MTMSGIQRRLILFARFPALGKAKTRLIPQLGAAGATALYRRLLLRTLRTALTACDSLGVALELRIAGGDSASMRHWLGENLPCRQQCEGNIGQRMANALADSFSEGSTATVLIGSDCPLLTPEVLGAAFDALRTNPVVLGPATDGGYYLVGSTRPVPELFLEIAWGTSSVLSQSLDVLQAIGIGPVLLQPLADIDRPADLPLWNQIVAAEIAEPPRISIIIPTLNEAEQIGRTLATAGEAAHQVIVVDGGSTDATRSRAAASTSRAMILQSMAGRARQMNAGAAIASGNLLLFLHGDTLLPGAWAAVVTSILGQHGVAAGAFGFRIAEHFPGRSCVETIVNWRSRWLQCPYGDQALFLTRSRFEELGGFADLPIMEDYEIIQRLRKLGRVATANEFARTSGRRWQRLGMVRTTWINQLILAGFRWGVAPHKLAQMDGKVRHKKYS